VLGKAPAPVLAADAAVVPVPSAAAVPYDTAI